MTTITNPNPDIFYMEDDQLMASLGVSMPELEALHKTLGIALSNLMGKAGRLPPGTPLHQSVTSELALLSSLQQEVLGIYAEYQSG
jgi:hypothetical protein